MPGCNKTHPTPLANGRAALWPLLLALACLAGNVQAATKAVDTAADSTTSVKKPKAKKTKPPKLTASGGSEETKAERSARLKRECRGQVNAGACSGFTD